MKWKPGAKNTKDKYNRGDSCTAGDGCHLAERRYIAELILFILVQAKAVTVAGKCTAADRLRQLVLPAFSVE